ncbi:restriction endonuclease subunit S [Vibrio splendidus]
MTFGAFMSVFRSPYNDYLSKVFNSALFEYQSGSFLTATINQLTTANLNSFEIPLPPKGDRLQVVNFLDYETAKIDTLIDKQQQLIKLLKEKRQAMISHAVTKGLNPEVPMKDSGVEWLGEVPEHWVVLKLSRVGKVGQGCSFSHSLQGHAHGELPWFKVMDMNSVGNEELMFISTNYVSSTLAKRINAPIFPKGTIIFPRVGAALLTNKRRILTSLSIVDDNLYTYKPDRVSSRFAYRFLQLVDMETLCSPGLVPTITFSAVNNLRIPLPPQDEQKDIVQYIDNAIDKVDSLLQKSYDAIALLQERRTALISAAVTGKIDVRKWQAQENQETQQQEAG